MGSCISPVIANIYMEYIETKAISTFLHPPVLWLRYVDDTFCILHKEHADKFHEHINSICQHIQFTMETEQNSSLPFLDVLVSHSNDVICTDIYKKPTHTNRYLNFFSHHPKHQKLAVAKTLHDRIHTHISDNHNKPKETKNTQNILQLNDFPFRFTFPRKCKHRTTNITYNSFTTLPYVQGITEKIRRILKEAGIKVAMKPARKIAKFLPSPKDPLSIEDRSCLIYQVPCADCDYVYIGQTKRDLNTRLAEHKRSIKFQRPEKSALCEHVLNCDHKINWNCSQILKIEENFFRRLTAESWFINSHSHVMNRSDGDCLPSIYRSLIK